MKTQRVVITSPTHTWGGSGGETALKITLRSRHYSHKKTDSEALSNLPLHAACDLDPGLPDPKACALIWVAKHRFTRRRTPLHRVHSGPFTHKT